MSDPVFFVSQAEWRKWLERNHATKVEIMVGLVKVGSGLEGIGYREALDEALCYGWIDGVRQTIDDKRWMIRFTPRKPKSYWSAVNRKRAEELIREGRMARHGLAVYERRDKSPNGFYSFENKDVALAPAEEKRFKSNRVAWRNFSAMPPSYRRPATWWVISAKRPETREKRLTTLIADSEADLRIKPLRRPGGQ